MSSTAKRAIAEAKVQANRLKQDLYSTDPHTVTDAALRLVFALPPFADRTTTEVVAERDSIQRKAFLNVIAHEWGGYTCWEDLVAAVERRNTMAVSDALVAAFEEEIHNERQGGDAPATLSTVLDSLKQVPGAVLRRTPNSDPAAVERELRKLMSTMGPGTELREVLRVAHGHRFFDAMDAKHEAVRPEVRAIMKAAGYEWQTTGGGLMAWQKDLSEEDFLWIVNHKDQALLDGDPSAEIWGVGRYHSDGGWIELHKLYTLATAVVIAGSLPSPFVHEEEVFQMGFDDLEAANRGVERARKIAGRTFTCAGCTPHAEAPDVDWCDLCEQGTEEASGGARAVVTVSPLTGAKQMRDHQGGTVDAPSAADNKAAPSLRAELDRATEAVRRTAYDRLWALADPAVVGPAGLGLPIDGDFAEVVIEDVESVPGGGSVTHSERAVVVRVRRDEAEGLLFTVVPVEDDETGDLADREEEVAHHQLRTRDLVEILEVADNGRRATRG